MRELLLLAAMGGALWAYNKKKKTTEAAVIPDPFRGRCFMDLDDAKEVVERLVKPYYYSMMRPGLMATGKLVQQEQFTVVWTNLVVWTMSRYAPKLMEQKCTDEYINRAYQEFAGLIACMVLNDLMNAGRIDDDQDDLDKLCAMDPQEVTHHLLNKFGIEGSFGPAKPTRVA